MRDICRILNDTRTRTRCIGWQSATFLRELHYDIQFCTRGYSEAILRLDFYPSTAAKMKCQARIFSSSIKIRDK